MARPHAISPKERLIETARSLFSEQGVAAVSTERIAREARVSKATLYRYFDGKPGLFAAVIDLDSAALRIDPNLESETVDEFLEHVVEFGVALVRLLAKPETRRMSRAMISHASADPETAQLFFDRAIESTRDGLTRLIKKGVDLGFVDSDIPARRLATYLMSVWEGIDHYRDHLQLKDRPKTKSRALVEESCRLILRV